MQGRLTPPAEGRFQAFPREQWAEEFPRAGAAGIEAIEWIYDIWGLGANPLESDKGIERINRCCLDHRVAIRSLCADFFMERAFVRADEMERQSRLQDLIWLMRQARRMGVKRIVLPFVDQSAIRDQADCDAVVETLQRALPAAREYSIELHLETSLGPADFAALLERIPEPQIKVNYDSGNSASLGYRAAEEFAAYGSRVGSVHIKDRLRGGGTVPLGSGDVDFEAVFSGLRRLGYEGGFVLQAARGKDGAEIDWARANLAFLKKWWNNGAPNNRVWNNGA